MPRKFKLLKEVEHWGSWVTPVGTIFSQLKDIGPYQGGEPNPVCLSRQLVENNPDFFEEVFEEKENPKPSNVIIQNIKCGECHKCGEAVEISEYEGQPSGTFYMKRFPQFAYTPTGMKITIWGHECKK